MDALDTVVEERAGPCQWSARHDEFIFATEIECSSANGGLFRWELSHSPPRRWLSQQPLYLTPLNRAAAALLPELLPSGMTSDRVPQQGRYGSGFLYDLARPGGNPEFGGSLRRRGLTR